MEAQEGAICKFTNCLDKTNICTQSKMILGVVNYFIRFENRVVSYQ